MLVVSTICCSLLTGLVRTSDHSMMNRRLSANSILGVYLAKVAWDEIYVEADYDCYFEFRKFIVE